MRVLTKRFSPKFLDALLFVMHELYLSPQETVYTQGSVTDYSLYYVAKGEVELYHGTLTATDSQQM
jgi:CRP-like cAMP-binding protein